MRRGNVLATHRLEIEHVDGVFRALDQLLQILWRPCHGIGKSRRRFAGERRKAGARQQRAAGDELEELTAACSLINTHIAFPPLVVLASLWLRRRVGYLVQRMRLARACSAAKIVARDAPRVEPRKTLPISAG